MCLAMRKTEKTRGYIPQTIRGYIAQNIRGYIPENIMEQDLEHALTWCLYEGACLDLHKGAHIEWCHV